MDESNEYYEQKWKNYWKGFTEHHGPSSRHRTRLIIKLFEKYNIKGRILDSGCGDGYLLSKLVDVENQLFGCDISKTAVESAIERFGKFAQFSVGDITKIETPPLGEFDAIICAETLEHIKEDDLAIRNLYAKLNKGGKLIIVVPHKEKYWTKHDEASGHFRRYEQRELCAKLEENSFRIVESFTWGYPIYDIYYRLILENVKSETLWEQKGFLKEVLSKILYYLFYFDDIFINNEKGRKLFILAEKADLINLDDKAKEKVDLYLLEEYGSALNREKIIYGLLNKNRMEYQLSQILRAIPLNLEKAKILEIGSGLGAFILVCQKEGINSFGLELNKNAANVANGILKKEGISNKVVQGVGESLPYKNNSFDLVTSFQVLEHTQNPEKVLKESVRVLKKGGYLYFVIPNYNSFFEGHYGLLWLPRFPKPLAKLYLRFRGRDPSFIDDLQYITPKMILNAISQEDVEIISWGVETWERRLDTLNFPTWGSTKKLLHLAKLAHGLKITSLIKYLGKKLDFYYPIILIVKKK